MRRLLTGLAVLLIAAGLGALLYHPVTAWFQERRRAQEIQHFQQICQQAEAAHPAAGASPGSAFREETPDALPFGELLQAMEDYNREIFRTGQKDLVDAWSYEKPVFDLEAYGVDSDLVGYLEIPAMEQRLPIYLGASQENLDRGVAVLGQTSMPIGGEDTNCVIAGHRGNGGEAIFREIQRLQPGDPVYLTNLWRELTYRVESAQVIQPDDLSVLAIQEGEDRLTLISCYYQGQETLRYAVYCVRDGNASLEKGGETICR